MEFSLMWLKQKRDRTTGNRENDLLIWTIERHSVEHFFTLLGCNNFIVSSRGHMTTRRLHDNWADFFGGRLWYTIFASERFFYFYFLVCLLLSRINFYDRVRKKNSSESLPLRLMFLVFFLLSRLRFLFQSSETWWAFCKPQKWKLRFCSLTCIKQSRISTSVVAVKTVCCQDVRAPCSLHLKAFPPLRIVFLSYNNGFTVYPDGDFAVKTYKVAPPSLLIIIIDSIRAMLH